MANLSLVLHPSLELKIEERPVPNIKPDEVLLNMKFTGICGTDLHMWSHGGAGMVKVTQPMVLGHESSGLVVKVGDKVKHLKEGDRVCVEPVVPCSNCEFCLRGNYNHCLDLVIRGYTSPKGMCSTYYSHPARFCCKLPDNVSFEEGALVEPLAVSVSGCKRAGIAAGQNVLVIGAGPVGILTMMCAKAMGVNQVCITDVRQPRLDLARKLGADHAVLVSANKKLADQVREAFGDLADVTIDCCGSPQSVPPAVLATRSTGNVTIVGMGGDEATISIQDVVSREVDIRGVFAYTNCFPTAVSLLATGAVNLRPLVTHKFDQSEAVKAFNLLSDENGGAMKVVLKVSE